MKVVVKKLPNEIRNGDYKDPPKKYSVHGPGSEMQMFSTKCEAVLYAKIRRLSLNICDAAFQYAMNS